MLLLKKVNKVLESEPQSSPRVLSNLLFVSAPPFKY